MGTIFPCYLRRQPLSPSRLLPTHRKRFVVNPQMEAQIVLGDRPVEVTLQRAWEALSLGERFDLGRTLLGLAFHRAGLGGGSGEGGSNAAEEV